jgi:hypothetical protein
MEQTEWREKLREIIKKSYFILGRTGRSGVVNMLEDFISQELDKAREEVFTIDELKFIRSYIATLVPRQKDLTSDGWKMRGDILNKLSKLKQ